MIKVLHVVGARPNFMKIAPIMREISRRGGAIKQVLVHTGQHYDEKMSGAIFEDLGLPQPDEFLGVGSGTHAEQTARIMLAFEPIVIRHRPDWVLVVGDVNSTVACALVAAKLGIPVVHVEAGLRSRDRTMPEELNRLVTDQLSDLLLTPSPDADENLRSEGIPDEKIRCVGNVMIDTLVRLLPDAKRRPILANLDVQSQQFVLATLHRPANVDEPTVLLKVLGMLDEIGQTLPVLFPVHPRTRARIEAAGWKSATGQVRILEPLGYLDCLALMAEARVVVTDSGGIQEETTFLGVPCLTLRPNTERPVTITAGTNRLVPCDPEAMRRAFREFLAAPPRQACTIESWDGRAAERVVDALLEASNFGRSQSEPTVCHSSR